MSKKGHSEEQIVTAFQQAEGGDKVADICRKMAIPGDVLYLEEAVRRFGDQRPARAAAAARRERPAEAPGRRPVARPPDLAGDRLKKALKPRVRRKVAACVQSAYRLSERRATRLA